MEIQAECKKQSTDPLRLLPAELVLRILDFTPASSLASLTRLSRSWNFFIDGIHQDAIYSSPSKTLRPNGSKDFNFLSEGKTFSQYFTEIRSWKDLCKRQILLAKNWNTERPVSRESSLCTGSYPVWRFRPDFQRRFFLSTSQVGGLNVTDFETGQLLWSLEPREVRPFAHLEYQDGTAVWDREGNALEVWRTDMDGLARGEFKRVAVLPHDRQTRGFQLSFNTLCVVSSQGEGYVYDMTDLPKVRTKIAVDDGAIGHLDQDSDAVVYSLGKKGYHFFDKTTGEKLGALKPKICRNLYHITHPDCISDFHAGVGNLSGVADVYPPQNPRKDRLTPLEVRFGPWPYAEGVDEGLTLEEDDWGAGMLCGSLMVGVSRAGRVLVCQDWRKALRADSDHAESFSIVECDSDGSTFDLGGWLSVRDHRVLFEIQERIYVLGLTDEDSVFALNRHAPRPSYAFSSSLAPQMATPVSFMALYDDCIMSTYTTLGFEGPTERGLAAHAFPLPRAAPAKTIRVLSLAPSLDDKDDEHVSNAPGDNTEPLDRLVRSDLYHLVAMLGGDADDY